MITPSDPGYLATKQIKRGEVQLGPPLDELAEWISKKWCVTVLNVIYDHRNDLHGPRLQVILEHDKDAQSFRAGFNFDKKKQSAIASQFIEIAHIKSGYEYDVDGLFVVFSAFAPLTLHEANEDITDEEINELKRRIDNAHLWEVSRCFGAVTFMFYTDSQVEEYAAKE